MLPIVLFLPFFLKELSLLAQKNFLLFKSFIKVFVSCLSFPY